MNIRLLETADFSRGFAETLSSLSRVDLTPSQFREVHERRLLQGIQTFVCIMDDRVVGTASLVLEQKFIHAGGRIGHIEDVAVHEDYRKHGIGQRLIDHLVEEGRRQRCYKVILECTDALVPFYSRSGFRRHNNGMRLDLHDVPAEPPQRPRSVATALAAHV